MFIQPACRSYCSSSCCQLSGRLGRNNNEFAACRTNTFSANDGDASAQYAADLAQAIKKMHRHTSTLCRSRVEPAPDPFFMPHMLCECRQRGWEGGEECVAANMLVVSPLAAAEKCSDMCCSCSSAWQPAPAPLRSSGGCSIETNALGVRVCGRREE